MASLQYLDFDLSIERAGDQLYHARVLHSPAGAALHTFALPFSALELENFCLKIGRPRRGIRRLESPEMAAAKNFGKGLFASVFDREVLGCFRSSLDQAEARGLGLRIRLRLNAPELIDLPWEYLYYPALNRFLVLAVETPLVRYVDLPQPAQPLAVSPPLRILVMISNLLETSGLDTEHEWRQLNVALAKLKARSLVELERLPGASLTALHTRLRGGPYHIFHFIGHGVFDGQMQDGMLLLEDEHRRSQRVSGQKLGTLLHNHRHLRLAVLNACEGARVARCDPFAGAALSLVQQGIPAVIAMQFEITDQAAVTFAREFYHALADGYPVDTAMVEARTGIYTMGNDVEWGTPVLYLHAPDGHIFASHRAPKEAKRATEFKALWQAATSAAKQKDWDTAIAKFEQLLARDPQNLEAQRIYKLAQEKKRLADLHVSAPVSPDVKVWQPSSAVRQRLQKLATNFTNFVEEEVLPAAARFARKAPALSKTSSAKRMHRALIAVLLMLGAIPLLLKLAQQRDPKPDSGFHHRMITEGDLLFKHGDYANAQKKYEEVLVKLPGDSVAVNKLMLCDQKISALGTGRRSKMLYTQFRKEADSLFIQNKYPEAKWRYQKALAHEPQDGYAAGQITLCEQKLADEAQKQERELLYAKCKEQAGLMIKQSDFFRAKKYYEQALRYKPDDAYAVQQIRACEKRLAQSSQLSQSTQPKTPLGMVRIPAGSFLMGSNGGDKDEWPLREVYIEAFYLDKHEVTAAQYQRFLKDRPDYREPEYWAEQLQFPQRPVVYVNWENAVDYCK